MSSCTRCMIARSSNIASYSMSIMRCNTRTISIRSILAKKKNVSNQYSENRRAFQNNIRQKEERLKTSVFTSILSISCEWETGKQKSRSPIPDGIRRKSWTIRQDFCNISMSPHPTRTQENTHTQHIYIVTL